MSFVHLRVHTEYSVSDSIIKVQELVSRVVEFGMPAVGVTEIHNVFSAIKVYSTCLQMGVKPIIGVEVPIENDDNPVSPHYLVLLCQNIEGYRAMCELLSKAHDQTRNGGVLQVKKKWLTPSSCAGLIALSAAQQGKIGQKLIHDRFDEARQTLQEYLVIFQDRFYLEISRVGGASEGVYGDGIAELAESTDTPIVATHHPRFLNKDDFGKHEIKVCIQDHTVLSDTLRRKDFTVQQYLCSSEEMVEKFSDIPAAIDNSVEIAKRCNLQFETNKLHMPAYPQTIEEPSIDEYLGKLSRKGLQERLGDRTDERYEVRLEEELNIIYETDYAGYFLIVAEIIDWAKKKGIPVGPGRGSGAGSLVAYCLNITTVDPIEHDLIFERFLNSHRVSPPDFDIDFCVNDRDNVIDHVSDTYGKDQVAQIVTYNTMAARAAIRDVGRALKPDYLFYDEIARLIPRDLNITLAQAMVRNSELRRRYEKEPRVKELIDSAQTLEGMIRNVSKHPGGVVIAPSRIANFSALFADSDGGRDVTHFDKDDLEAIGLVKFDFLGLTTLTTIAHTLNNLHAKQVKSAPSSGEAIPMNDKKTFEYICTGRTVGIFQLESKGMQRLILSMQPSEFNDLVALLALFRPGPLQTNMDQMYIENRKNKKYKVIHKDLKEILDQSHGVILYQEQVMKIAQVMSGYSLGEADILRWAMGKKVKKEMQSQRKRFVKGAMEKGYKEKLATDVYDLIESFGGYGFNKSHSVAYAILAYRTAYLKTHFRTEYLAACMTVDIKQDTIVKIFNDAKNQGIRFIPPDINQSEFGFAAISDNEILYGLGALKQIGASVVESIVEARNQGGAFKNLKDFCIRINLNQVGKAACQALINAGSFDSIDPNRAQLLKHLDSAYGMAQQRAEEINSGQMSFFGGQNDVEESVVLERVKPWSRGELLRREYAILGLYVSGHPFERYESELSTLVTAGRVAEIKMNTPEMMTICGWVVDLQIVDAKKGGSNAYFDLQNASGNLSVAVYSEVFERYSHRLKDNQPVVVAGSMVRLNSNSETRFVAKSVYDLATIRKSPLAQVVFKLGHGKVQYSQILRVKEVVELYSGGKHRIRVDYISERGTQARYSLDDNWRIEISDELLDNLRNIVGDECILADYSRVQLEIN